ncbi:MAG TPA: 4Fe-4S binding protein [Candidatus Limnocylindrales bacterium]|nr:4Fe-4S binding protein [Candidatus Limnocylindrales bacterium]
MEIKTFLDEERCKGCALCIDACPQQIIELAASINAKGFHPAAVMDQERCTGCALCALMCPDLVISVYRPERNPAKVGVGGGSGR